MSHEIHANDNVLLHTNRAWHGLGTVIDEDLTPREAMLKCGLDWGVEQYPLFAETPDGQRIEVPSHVLNIRADDETQLGVVGSNYEVVSNAELADFCESLAENDDKIVVETCGSLRGGKNVWFLLQGESFEIRGVDNLVPYILASNGHDGQSLFRMTPTSIRTVCANTFHMVIPRGTDDGRILHPASFVAKHSRNIRDRVEEAKKALQLYRYALQETREVAEILAKNPVNREQLGKFFVDVYSEMKGYEIPSNPKTKQEERRRNIATSAWNSFTRRFDDELELAGATLWNAANSFSGLVQHDMKARGKDDADRINKRTYSNLFGLNVKRTNAAFQAAYELAS